jgi:UTP--glucose-1-phosphate uridylyltransferase
MPEIRPVRKAVFPVAGLGTRLLPATKVMPKEMLTVVDKPLIQLAVEEARQAGIEQFIFVINHGKEMLLQHFDDVPDLMDVLEKRGKTELIRRVREAELPNGSLHTALQREALGLGHAVWCARQAVGDEPFAVLLPDDNVLSEEGCLAQMVRAYNKVGGNIIAVSEVPDEDTSKYGILDVAGQDGAMVAVKGLVEKPAPKDAPSNMAITGRYILQPEIFALLDKHERGTGGEIQLTDAMARLLATQDFHGLLFEGERLDCGNDIGFVKAQIAYALKNQSLAQEVADYMMEKLRAYHSEQRSSAAPSSLRKTA